MDRLYDDGRESERFRQRHHEIIASYGVALHPNDQRADRVTAGARVVNDTFFFGQSGIEQIIPRDREYRYLFVRYESAANDFVKLNFVNKDLRYEDFNLGRQYSAEAAVSPSAFGVNRNSGLIRLSASDGKSLGDGFILPSAGISTRIENGFQNAVATSTVLYVRRSDAETHPRAFVGRFLASTGWRMDREQQFFADGLTGLRGYRAHAFEGTRAFVVNVEERLYLGHEILQFASPGIVAFADVGNATDRGFSSLMHVRADAGIGIRVGLPRTPKNLLRIDLAYALNRDPLGRKGWLLAFSSGQAF
jgi:hypothetical protein